MPAESPGTLIGPYEVIQRLEGQASEVYLARRHGQERGPQFILILFEVRAVDARIIEAEVERGKRVDHRAIIRLVEMFEHDTRRVLVFDSVPGTSLQRLVLHLRREGERLADGAVFHIGKYLFGALAKAHTYEEEGKSAPVVHGQLGPHQVIISWTGAIAIMGFGMSRLFRLAESILAEPGELRPFLAPEQRAGYAPTARANVYSAAAMIWSLLVDELPPTDDSKPTSLGERRRDLPGEITAALDRALEPAITQRTILASELAAIFDRVATGDGLRELKWNMEVFKELKPAELGFIPPESVPPSLLSDVPDGDEEQPPPSSDGDLEPTASHKIPRGVGVYSMIGEPPSSAEASPPSKAAAEPKAKKKLGRVQSIGAIRTKAKQRPRHATLVGTGPSAVAEQPAPAGPAAPPRARREELDRSPSAPRPQRSSSPAPRKATPPVTRNRSTKPYVAKSTGGEQRDGDDDSGTAVRPRRDRSTKPSVAQPTPPALPEQRPTAEAQERSATTPAHPRDVPSAPSSPDGAPAGVPPPTVGEAVDRVAPLPPPVVEQAATSEPLPAPPEPADDDGFYVRPSLRPGALSDAPFLTPSLHPAALGGAPFSSSTALDGGPMSVRTVGSAFQDADSSTRFKLSTGGLPLKWTAAVAITAVLSFVAGLLVASGPIEVHVGGAAREDGRNGPDRASGATTGKAHSAVGESDSPGEPGARSVQARSAVPARAPRVAAAGSAAPAKVVGATTAAADDPAPPLAADGSNLPAHEGYLRVRCPERPTAHVYVLGKPMGEVDERLRVSCGLVNVRLGDRPLSQWYGKGHAVQVDCQSSTEVSLEGRAALEPGWKPPAAGAKASKKPAHPFWVPSSL